MKDITQNISSGISDAVSSRRSVMDNFLYYNPSIILLGIIIISSLVGILTILG